MTFAVPLKVTIRLVVWDKDAETGAKTHPRHQGAGGLLRRHPADDGERDLHHQRHRAGHRQPAPPLAGRLLLAAREGPLRGADHPLPRQLGGVRVRLQEPAPRPDRPQAQVPGLGLPAGAGHELRLGDPASASTSATASRSARGGSSGRSPTTSSASSSAKSILGRTRRRAASATRSLHAGKRDHRRRTSQQIQQGWTSRRSRSPRPTSRAPAPSRTSSTRARARSCSRATSPCPPRVLAVVLAPEGSQIDAFEVFFPERDDIGPMLSTTVKKDTIKTPEEALIEIYRRMRPGRPADPRVLEEPLRRDVPERAEVRLLAGGPAQAQHQARPLDAAHREDPPPRGHQGGRSASC